jgi:hypothetical protein
MAEKRATSMVDEKAVSTAALKAEKTVEMKA